MIRLFSDRRVLLLAVTALAALASLPQILPLHSVVDHQDPLFSMWRIAWIGHALAENPSRLFHGNIFYPHLYTLTYSDAVLVQGIAGTALRLMDVAVPVAYNLLIWISFPASALFMFLLAEKASGSALAAAPAALAYALSAYRFDHIMHLEQVWTQWLPLALYLTLVALDRGTWRSALALGASLLLQLFSGLYLFVFAVTALPVFVFARWAAARRIPWQSALRIAIVGIVFVAPFAASYAYLYTLGLQDVGTRSLGEVQRYSATLGSFFASPERSLLLGWTQGLWGAPTEQQLFPGLIASILAVGALARIRTPDRMALTAVAIFAALMALGANGFLYPIFYELVPGYANLRVPTRFGALLSLAVAGLAACGCADLLARRLTDRARLGLTMVLCALVLAATATGQPYRRTVPESPTLLDRYLAAQPDAVVIEYPFALSNWLPAYDALYQMRSIHHWRPLVNGYSGNYPPEYPEMLDRLAEARPASASWIATIRASGATHLIVHKGIEKPDVTGKLLFELEQRPELESLGQMACWPDSCAIYLIKR